jgi:hypothetical protein
MCDYCTKREAEDNEKITKLMDAGHSYHCAARHVWGDGGCEGCDLNPVCLECLRPAVWVRHTQFSGNHPFCEEHAQKEKNFGKEDPSYFFWRRLIKEET